jgi:MFS family permease
MTPTTPSANAFKYPAYVKYLLAITAHSFAMQIMSMAMSWQIYDITHDAFYLALIGLVQFLPALLLVLVTGLAADHFNRRIILLLCIAIEILGALGLVIYSLSHQTTCGLLWPFSVVWVSRGPLSAPQHLLCRRIFYPKKQCRMAFH